MITSFRGEYGFLSNFTKCPVEFEGVVYDSVEYAYQAAKSLDPDIREMVRKHDKPKQIGNMIRKRPDWQEVNLEIMEYLVRQKFNKEPFRSKLLETGDQEILELNTWNDTFYGVVSVDGEWVGENHLGKMLMKIRAELRLQ